jgi:hypothetical protein
MMATSAAQAIGARPRSVAISACVTPLDVAICIVFGFRTDSKMRRVAAPPVVACVQYALAGFERAPSCVLVDKSVGEDLAPHPAFQAYVDAAVAAAPWRAKPIPARGRIILLIDTALESI